MNIFYYEDSPSCSDTSIFLAGPTSKEPRRTAWRLRAIDHLKSLDYDKNVLVPEFQNGDFVKEKQRLQWFSFQILDWETRGLTDANVILFWMPFDDNLPGLTTRAEFGYWVAKDPKKMVVGLDSHMSTGFIFYHAMKASVPVLTNLKETCAKAIEVAQVSRFDSGQR